MSGNKSAPDKLGFVQIMKSVFAASIGIQSNKNHDRDFTRGSARTFIVAGIFGTLVFVLVVYTVVKLILTSVA